MTETTRRATHLLRGLRPMTGRDPQERHRGATPLELLFDLTFVVAFGQAADGLAHLLAEGHIAAGLLAFVFAMFAICWAWINFTWFASAYDTDDWYFRVTTMVQMVGVVILALGLPAVFDSIDDGGELDNGVVASGYVIMRVAMVAQWMRAARQDPSRRVASFTTAGFIVLSQVGWVVLALARPTLAVAVPVFTVLFLIEMAGPVIAQRSGGFPWHPHHIAERYGLLTIIALGEGVLGTVASVSAVTETQGWSSEAVLLVIAGVGLTFGLWWCYFIMPSGEILARYRERSFVWGYGHIVIFAAIAAVGGGLHVAAYVIEGEAVIGTLGAVVSVAVPIAVFTVTIFLLYSHLLRTVDPLHIGLFSGTVITLAVAVALAASGASLGLCLIVMTLAPAVIVVGYEVRGNLHQADLLGERLTD